MEGAHTKTHIENLNQSKVHFLSSLSFLLGFLDAFFIYVISSYFAIVGGNERVGIFYFLAFSGVLLLFFDLQFFLRRFGTTRLLFFILFLLVVSAAFLSLRTPSWTGAIILLFFLVMNNSLWVVLDIILEGFSADHVSGRVRGLYLTIMNAGLLTAPLLSTLILGRFGYGGIFLGLTLGYSIVFIILLLQLRGPEKLYLSHAPFRILWKKLKSQPNLFRIYHISFALEFFYAIMLVYTPIYLIGQGFTWEDLGIVFTVMLLPFVLLQYPLGVLADKNWGEKELLLGSLLLLGGATAVFGFTSSKSLLVWGALLFFTRVGAAALEVLRDSYFYKQIDGRDSGIIAFFRTARPIGNILGALVSFFFLIFFPLKSVFFLVALVALSACFSLFFLKDTLGERERRGKLFFRG